MFCPLKFNPKTSDNPVLIKGCECEQGKCAWWDASSERCAIRDLAWALENIYSCMPA